MQANGFRVYCTPLFEVLFTFPSRYWFTIGLKGIFSLAGWAPLFLTGFLVSRDTQDTTKADKIVVYGVITLCDSAFQRLPLTLPSSYNVVLQPPLCRNKTGLGCSAFARRYLRNHFCFLFLRVMRCFSSPGWLYQCIGNV